MTLGMEVGLGPGDFVFDGDPATPRTEDAPSSSHFLAHVYCGQTAGWMKTPLGTEVDIGPGHTVLDRVPALRERGTAAPHILDPCLLWPRSRISATAELLLYSSWQSVVGHIGTIWQIRLNMCFLGPTQTQTTNCPVELLLHSSWQKVPILTMGVPYPQNCPFPIGDLDPPYNL